MILLYISGLCICIANGGMPNKLRHHGQKGKRKSAKGLTYNHFLQLRNVDNVLFVGDLDVGGQVLPVLYDTGSSEIVVESKNCERCKRSTSPMYDERQSQTFAHTAGHVAEHVFGSGPALCQHGLESIRLGDRASPVNADAVPFWQVLNHNISFWDEHPEFSGIAGLGPLSHTPDLGEPRRSSKDVTLLEALDVNSFAICLERAAAKSPGWLITGPYVDAVAEKKGFMSIPVVGQFHWAVQMTKLQVGNKAPPPEVDVCNPSCIAIVDSGTSFIGAPSAVIEQLTPLFDSIRTDCSNLNELPDITFMLGGKPISLPPAAYVIKRRGREEARKTQNQGNQNSTPALRSRSSSGLTNWGKPGLFAVRNEHADSKGNFTTKASYESLTEMCMPAFFQIDVDTDHGSLTWILGMPFLRYYYTVFQRQPPTLHVALSTSTCSPVLKRTLVSDAPQDSAVTITTLAGVRPQEGYKHFENQVMSVDASNLRVAPWALRSTGTARRMQL
eukprot:gnl/MRDRNA2_/MRDRNA2_31218_c0_seq1.p1 gnl/MRDRNA2_/MRDRNA2_31218_c0~~gnl/MRDRNA2_/MRDRNA2_31218_c0_seq1.p1  ORF type:complete len:501 (+),score=73.10 gnl/MRDRNA2_/MRDRNA2_31218_c0_seq1:70-1572(+)